MYSFECDLTSVVKKGLLNAEHSETAEKVPSVFEKSGFRKTFEL